MSAECTPCCGFSMSQGTTFFFAGLLISCTEVKIAFKGFHEDVDSLGSFEYPDEPSSWAA